MTLVAFVSFFMALLAALHFSLGLIYPLLFGLLLFSLAAYEKGHPLSAIGRMLWQGAAKSLVVIRIFILIGAITAVWRAAGTVPFIVYHGVQLIRPELFILFAFLLNCFVSFLLGTSFGTVGTMGIVMMIMAQTGQVDVNMTAGAIIAGAYFGDRCSPMSSSANLVSILTRTDLYVNIRNMFVSAVIPLLLSIAAYGVLASQHPLTLPETGIAEEIAASFNLSWLTAIPAALILVMAALRLDVRLAMLASIVSASLLAIFVQQQTALEILRSIIIGYHPTGEGFFLSILRGGGLISMLNVTLIVLISSSYAGLFSGAGLLKELTDFFRVLARGIGVYGSTCVASTFAAAFSCNQTLAVLLTHQLQEDAYEKNENELAALDLENTVIMISALIPWNIAGALPAAALSADSGFIPYAFYIYLVPIVYWFTRKKTRNET